ncbi:3-oxoacyl-[acyl-carrier-protein] reductase FabG [Pigmentiphaga humi]|uniref:3-oxoacyl-[acyl-carrier-protein] reductase FabG n=1 Tax=Pigmentiphaga humi TaxID=2478468 RepID=A0A3P4AVU6_9BURK|nr:SDR family oxidoreductase [Pigmentiphaga humi]VCU68137.1 3-oxoacyl-[acyl-carrier-protein] reductase FabG [Pigmentiphaga humi]
MNSKALNGKTAVVTGGSSGIGAACAQALAAEGARVAVGYHTGRERAEALLAELPGQGHFAVRIALDEIHEHGRIAEQVGRELGRVDILVNSAGYTRRIPHDDLDRMDAAAFGEILNANAVGPFSIIRAFLPLLRQSGDGLVVNVSSVSAFTGSGSNVAYCAAKAALDTLTISMARAFGPEVRCLSVSPASVDTQFVAGRSREELQKKAAQTPLGRVVTPQDVAMAVLACATHLKTATGTRIVIDGGHTL